MVRDPAGELTTERAAPPVQTTVESYAVSVIEGPDAGASYTLPAGAPHRLLLGTSAACTLRLTDREVSRRHCALRPEPERGALVIIDLGSTNGTFVNGVSIREAFLHGGETVRIGTTTITVSRGMPCNMELVQDSAFGRMLGESRAMRALYPILHQVAPRDFCLLLEGEPGVGKQLCAQEIHAYSPREDRPFVSLACQAIPLSEIEARIFDSGGLVEEAAGGTIYVDEVGALPGDLQSRLFATVSSPTTEVRLLFGTRLDLDSEVSAGRFREDLFEVLAPRRIELPPLRVRAEDVELLARAFWSALVAESTDDDVSPTLPSDLMPRFQNYRWPGNVRELARAVCTRFCLGEFGRWQGDIVRNVGDDAFAGIIERELPLADARDMVIEEFERRYVKHMFDRFGTTREAAKAAGVAQRYFQVLRARFRV
jgi:DNA-binding NtrC family response regulator